MAYAFPSGQNTYIAHAQSGVMINYVKNVKKFPFLDYVQYVEVDKNRGFYGTYRSENAARIVDAYGSRYAWPRGADRPTGYDEVDKFTWLPYETQRKNFSYALPVEAVDQAEFDILKLERDSAAQRAMTLRGMQIATALTGADYASVSNTDTATNLGGGKFDAATETAPYIRIGITKALSYIQLRTGGAMGGDFNNFRIVMNPNTAMQMAGSQEMVTTWTRSQFALQSIERDPKIFNTWGLPHVIANIPVLVDDTVRISSRDGATLSSGYTLPDNEIYIVTRPHGLTSDSVGIAFSSVAMFWFKDLFTIEEFNDDVKRHRRYEGAVVQDIEVQATSVKSMYKITGVYD